jgi:energy-converting hydrogenase Eha subunit C
MELRSGILDRVRQSCPGYIVNNRIKFAGLIQRIKFLGVKISVRTQELCIFERSLHYLCRKLIGPVEQLPLGVGFFVCVLISGQRHQVARASSELDNLVVAIGTHAQFPHAWSGVASSGRPLSSTPTILLDDAIGSILGDDLLTQIHLVSLQIGFVTMIESMRLRACASRAAAAA